MPAELICTSHSPLMNIAGLVDRELQDEMDARFADLGVRARAFSPDLVVQFGNDHNSGFSLKLMPPFLIGLRGAGVGDFNTPTDALFIDEGRARALVRHLHANGFDVATSYQMNADHGFTQALHRLFGGVDRVPVIPVFTNCGGDLRPPPARSMALGAEIGKYFAHADPDLRVLFIGSGGLSHDPPLPNFETSPADVQEKMIEGTEWTPETLELRTQRVCEAGREHGRGEGVLQPLNPEWDEWILDHFSAGSLEEIAMQSDHDIVQKGGRGGSEIRNWLAAFAALRAYNSGQYDLNLRYYRPIPSWIVGFAMAHAAAIGKERNGYVH